MLIHHPYEQLGHARHGWLDARHHFSFGTYHHPERMGLGTLRVINDDRIRPGTGFAPHSHRDMEIITYVREGAITHTDNAGNQGRTGAGDVQVMSAGSGIEHAEYNRESEDTRLYQIWIHPNQKSVRPRWDSHRFPKHPSDNTLALLVCGDGTAPLFIHQDAYIYAGTLTPGASLIHTLHHRQAYVLLSRGQAQIDGTTMKEGDGAEVRDADAIKIFAITECELLVIDMP